MSGYNYIDPIPPIYTLYVDILKVTSIHVLNTITSKHAYLMGHVLLIF